MILSFKTELNGSPTLFREKILVHLGEDAISAYYKRRAELYNEVEPAGLACWDKPKKLTIRDDPHNRWSAGRKIHFATGARTKQYECFAEGECKEVARLFIWRDKEVLGTRFSINGLELKNAEFEQLAKDDGFDNVYDFINFHLGKNDSVTKKIIYF